MKTTSSCGNVFADLNLPHADEMKKLASRCKTTEQFSAGVKVIVGLHSLYDSVVEEPIPEDMQQLLNRLS